MSASNKGWRIALLATALGLAACRDGPTERDLAGCTVRSGGPPISLREVAECDRDRAARGTK